MAAKSDTGAKGGVSNVIDRYAKPPSERNDRSELLGSDRHLRRDCQTIVQMLSLGVIPEEEIEEIIKLAPGLAKAAAEGKKQREYAAVMRVLTTAAKLGIDARPKQVNHDHVHSLLSPDERADLLEAQMVAELERRGEIIDGHAQPVGTGIEDPGEA